MGESHSARHALPKMWPHLGTRRQHSGLRGWCTMRRVEEYAAGETRLTSHGSIDKRGRSLRGTYGA